MIHIKLSEDRKRAVLHSLIRFYREDLDEELSEYQADRILEFFVKELGPPIYNQAIQDARSFVLTKMEDLDAEFYEPDNSADDSRD